MIREATGDDIFQLVAWGEDFAEACSLPGGIDRVDTAEFFAGMIESPNAVLLIDEGGAIGGMVHPSPYNKAHITGQELFWWVDPAKRGGRLGLMLLEALEDAVRAKGAHSWTMASVGLDNGSVGRILERRGYRQTDRNYTKIF